MLDAGTGKVDLQRAVDGGGHNLTLTSGNARGDAVHLGNTVANTAQLTVNGPSTLGGNVSSSGNQRYNGPVTLTGDVALDAGAARVDVQGNVDGGTHNFSLASSASAANAITLNGSVANVSGFAASGNAILGGNVISTGSQTYTGTVGLTTDATLNAGTGKIDLQSAVDAAGHALGLTSSNAAADAVRVGAAIANASQLTVTGNSTLTTGIATTGAQTYTGSATLLADITLTGPSVSFGSTVDGAHALTINATATTFAGAVGGSTALTSLTTNAAGTTQLGSNVTTSGKPDLQRRTPAQRQRGPERQHAPPWRQRRRGPRPGGQRQHQRHARRADRRRHGARRPQRRWLVAAHRRQHHHHRCAKLRRSDHAPRRDHAERALDRLRQHARRRLRPDDAKRRDDLLCRRDRRDDAAGQPHRQWRRCGAALQPERRHHRRPELLGALCS